MSAPDEASHLTSLPKSVISIFPAEDAARLAELSDLNEPLIQPADDTFMASLPTSAVVISTLEPDDDSIASEGLLIEGRCAPHLPMRC